jgi:hypothetical protein
MKALADTIRSLAEVTAHLPVHHIICYSFEVDNNLGRSFNIDRDPTTRQRSHL